MLNEETSTAALIPFDRVFQLTSTELKEDYRVNLFARIKRENSELIGMFGELENDETEAEAEADEGGNDDENEIEGHSENETNEGKGKNGKKKKRKILKKAKELEYDLEDPFIDDSEITDIYQSVFELMRCGTLEAEEEDEEGKENLKRAKSNVSIGKPKRTRNFFVYRGTMTPEILSKEFEIDVNELQKVESQDGEEDGEGSGEGGDEVRRKKRVRVKGTGKEEKATGVKRQKTAKPAVEAKKKNVKEKEVKAAKVTELINQSAKKFSDIFSTDETGVTVTLFNVTGVDANLLELREIMKRFRDVSVVTQFSPGKFPSILRPNLNETLCGMLRCCRPSLQSPLPARFFPALASFLPFSPAAVHKLLSRKILMPLIDSMAKSEIPKLYAAWENCIGKRIKEDGSIIIVSAPNIEDAASVTTTMQSTSVSNAMHSASVISTPNTPSPLKMKLKFNDEMRQIIFEILRTEIDLNNLIILSNTLEAAGSSSTSETTRVAQSELNLRKNVYQKLANCATIPDSEAQAQPLLSSTEISKEFSAQKRKHEKKISKAASEILFGEVEIEEFLKDLDVPKEGKIAVSVGGNDQQTMQGGQATVQVDPSTRADPLNLFANDQVVDNPASNTSLFMENSN